MSNFYINPSTVDMITKLHELRARKELEKEKLLGIEQTYSELKAGKEKDLYGTFIETITNILRPPRTSPKLIPYIYQNNNWTVVNAQGLAKFVGNNINNQKFILENTVLLEATRNDPQGESWSVITGELSQLTGQESRNSYEKALDRLDTYMVETTFSPLSNTPEGITAWFHQTFKDNAKLNNISIVAGAPVSCAIHVKNAKPYPAIYESKVRVAVTGKFNRESDPDKFLFYPANQEQNFYPVSGPYEDVPKANPNAKLMRDIEHSTLSVSAEGIQNLLSYYKATRENVERKKFKSDELKKTILDHIDKIIKMTQEQLDLSKIAGKVFGDILPQEANTSATRIAALFKSLADRGNTVGLEFVQYNTSTLDIETVTLTNTMYLEAANRGQNVFMLGFSRANRGWLATFEKSRVAATKEMIFTSFSPSGFTKVMMASLAQIFQNKIFLKQIKQYTNTKSKSKKIYVPLFTKKKIKLITPDKKTSSISKLNKAKRTNNKSKTYRAKRSISSIESFTSILHIINANMFDAVVSQMKSPSLVNRTGRFARSVQAIELIKGVNTDTFTVKYNYMENPYKIFSQDKGKSPWNNDIERDPATIIDAAIKSIGYNKLLGTLETVGAR